MKEKKNVEIYSSPSLATPPPLPPLPPLSRSLVLQIYYSSPSLATTLDLLGGRW